MKDRHDCNQATGIRAAVIVCPGQRWESIWVVGVSECGNRLEAIGGPHEFPRLRAEVRGWGLVERVEQQTLVRLNGLEREYRDWKARQINRRRINVASVSAFLLGIVVLLPLAIFGAIKLLGW